MNKKETNVAWARSLISKVCSLGATDFVVCAGARNSVLVRLIETCAGIKAWPFFDERSASFFALGLSKNTQKPVVVVTTSGTAVAELLPAVCEAFHSGVPLVCLTADRPKRLRFTGAPQTMNQKNIFGSFVQASFDVERGDSLEFDGSFKCLPIHINACFDEPLIDDEMIEWAPENLNHMFLDKFKGISFEAGVAELDEPLSLSHKPLVIVGTLESKAQQERIKNFLLTHGLPTYAESASGLGLDSDLQSLLVYGGEGEISRIYKTHKPDLWLRLGGIPTAKIWRELENDQTSKVISVSHLPFSGLSRGQFYESDYSDLNRVHSKRSFSLWMSKVQSENQKVCLALKNLFKKFPNSEPSMLMGLASLVGHEDLVYVGNSLPIREWDLIASNTRSHWIKASRGLNGIDGQISTFFGMCVERDSPNWCVVGDLTAMYDLSAPWVLRHFESQPLFRLVIVNNGGGKIFSKVSPGKLFENPHDQDFKSFSDFWKIPYVKIEKLAHLVDSPEPLPERCLLEIAPSLEETELFWKAYESELQAI